MLEIPSRPTTTHSTLEPISQPRWKMFALLFFVGAAMAALTLRLVWLQIIQTNFYKARAVENSTRVTFLRAPRGIIYDRHGNMLATNKQTLSLVAIPLQIDDVDDLTRRLGKILNSP